MKTGMERPILTNSFLRTRIINDNCFVYMRMYDLRDINTAEVSQIIFWIY